MPTYPMVKFVASPATSAAVRYDFNLTTQTVKTHVLHNEGFDLGAATLEGEPDAMGVEYGLREIRFTQRIEGARANAMAKQSALARELLRAENWLMVQTAADKDPVWYHTYRTSPGSLSFENVSTSDGPDAWDIGVTVAAEPFAYGARVTLSPITINNDPASGSNPVSATLPAILGDAPAPCRIQVNPSIAASMDGYRWMIAHYASDSAWTPIFWQIGSSGSDGWTAVTDTSASTADATMSGGYRRTCTFATTPTMARRLSTSSTTIPPRGQYKVLVRVARSDTSSTFSLQAGQNDGGNWYFNGHPIVYMDRVPSFTAGHATWVDLGEVSFPRLGGQIPATVTDPPAVSLGIQAARLSGAGSLHFDCVALVPISAADSIHASTLFTNFPHAGVPGGTGVGVWDGDTESFWAVSSVTDLSVPLGTAMQGGFPQLVPGASNTIHLLQQANGTKETAPLTDSADILTASTSVTISYHPRWLWIGDG